MHIDHPSNLNSNYCSFEHAYYNESSIITHPIKSCLFSCNQFPNFSNISITNNFGTKESASSMPDCMKILVAGGKTLFAIN